MKTNNAEALPSLSFREAMRDLFSHGHLLFYNGRSRRSEFVWGMLLFGGIGVAMALLLWLLDSVAGETLGVVAACFCIPVGLLVLGGIVELVIRRINDAGLSNALFTNVYLLLGISMLVCYLAGAEPGSGFAVVWDYSGIATAYHDGVSKVVAYVLCTAFYMTLLIELACCALDSEPRDNRFGSSTKYR